MKLYYRHCFSKSEVMMTGSTVVLCEKPSQAQAHAQLFGIADKGKGFIKVKNGWIFTWSIGHMVEMLTPDKLDAKWEKGWSLETLPIIPSVWRMGAAQGKADQLKIVLGLLKSATEIIIATDCGREGELIGRELIELSGNRKHTLRRFWCSSLDEVSLRAAWKSLRDGREFDTLYHAALLRQRFDYMWGMTNSRGATLVYAPPNVMFPIGRVQTPTLYLVVLRHLAITNFVPRIFFTLQAQVDTPVGSLTMSFAPKGDEHRLWEKSRAETIAHAVRNTRGQLSVESKDRKQAPPKFPSLSDLQKEASRRWKWTLDRTLDTCQALYDNEYVSYPRTSCNFMPEEQMSEVPGILAALQRNGWAPPLSVTGTHQPLYRRDRIKPQSVIEADYDHHAILPTATAPNGLTGDEQLLYQLIVLYYVRSFAPDYEYNEVNIALPASEILLTASGTTPLKQGFKALEATAARPDEDGDEADQPGGNNKLPPVLDGMAALVRDVEVVQGQTKAPAYYTEGTLLGDMIGIHKYVQNAEHRARLKETSGLGTEATRAPTIKEHRARGLIVQKDKKKGTIDCSPNALMLIQSIPQHLRDPGQTAIWEDYMDQVRSGKISFESAMDAATNMINKCAVFFQSQGLNKERATHQTPVLEHNGYAASCPTCSKPLSFRKNGKFGPYWACTDTQCKTTMKAAPDGKPVPKIEAAKGDLCPKCQKHHLVLRNGPKGHFWSCGGYPKCKHTANLPKTA
nr:DNA topoisomerase [Pseudomonas luteola]